MAKRLDSDVREFAEEMQRRRNEATKRVAAGELPHLNFMSLEDLEKKMARNVAQVNPGSEFGLEALADVGNYGLAILTKAPAQDGD